MSKSQFKTMLENVDPGDFEELRDIMEMMGQDIEAQDKKIKRLEKKVRRVNEMYPSTVVKKS